MALTTALRTNVLHCDLNYPISSKFGMPMVIYTHKRHLTGTVKGADFWAQCKYLTGTKDLSGTSEMSPQTGISPYILYIICILKILLFRF